MTRHRALNWLLALAIVAIYAAMQTLDGPDDIATAQRVADDLASAQASATKMVAADAISMGARP